MAQAFEAGSIFVNLRTRVKEWREGFKQARSTARRFSEAMKRVGDRLKKVGAGMRGFARTLTTKVTLPLTIAFGLIVRSMDKQIQAEAKLDAAIAATGGSANVTAEHVKTLASDLQKVTTFGDEATIEMAALAMAFTEIKNQGTGANAIFDRTIRIVTDFAAATGRDATSGLLMLGKAINDPATGLSRLAIAGVTFTDQTKEQILQLAKQGDLLEAQSILIDELSARYGGFAEALGKVGIAPLKQGFNALGDSLEKFGNVMQPAIDAVGQGLKDFAAWLGDLSTGKKRTLLILGALVAGIAPLLATFGVLVAAIGFAIPALTSFGLAMHATLGPIGLLAIAIGAVTFALSEVLAGHIAGTKQMKRYGAEAQRLSKTMEGLDAVLDKSRNTLIIKFGDALRAFSKANESADFGSKKWEELGLAVEEAALKIQDVKTIGEGILGQAGVTRAQILQFKDSAERAIAEEAPIAIEMRVTPTPEHLARLRVLVRNFGKEVQADLNTVIDEGGLAIVRMTDAIEKFGDRGREDLKAVASEGQRLQTKILEIAKLLRDPGTGAESFDILFQRLQDLIAELDELRAKIVLPPKQEPIQPVDPEQQALANSVAQAGQAIGRGLLQGISEGKRGLELFAEVGRQIFVEAGNKAITQLSVALGDAIAKAANTSSALVQGVLNTVIAAVGFILSSLDKSKDAVETFGDIAPEVESSQLIRGIVAGPQNVAIAEVGEDIATAFVPTNEWLAAIHGLILEGLLSVGAGGGGGTPSAGRTQTP